jgi:hypothetical protein
MEKNTLITHINNLDIEESIKETLIRLPYRIGLWVSQSDNVGGNEATNKELLALEGLVISYGEDVCKSEFTHSVMEKTIAAYEDWDQWRARIEEVPNECEKVMYFLSSQVENKSLSDFKSCLFEIAETVALAYRESRQENNFLDKLYIQIRISQKKWDAFIRRYDFSLDHVLNISPSEEQVLQKLKGLLRI